MSETNTGEQATQEAPVESGQPSESQSQQSTQPENQHQPQQQPNPQIDRLLSQVNGMRSIVEPLTKGGLNTPDAVQQAITSHQQLNQLRERGIDVNALLGTGNQPQQQAQEKQSNPLSITDIETMLETREAKATHTQANQQSTGTLQAFAKEVGGEQSGVVWQLTQIEASDYLKENGRLYPPNHPLHESDYMPLNESDINSIKANVQKKMDALYGMRARKGIDGTATPGSGNTMDGAATDPNRGTGLTDAASRKARVEELYRRNLAQGAGETISNA